MKKLSSIADLEEMNREMAIARAKRDAARAEEKRILGDWKPPKFYSVKQGKIRTVFTSFNAACRFAQRRRYCFDVEEFCCGLWIYCGKPQNAWEMKQESERAIDIYRGNIVADEGEF